MVDAGYLGPQDRTFSTYERLIFFKTDRHRLVIIYDQSMLSLLIHEDTIRKPILSVV